MAMNYRKNRFYREGAFHHLYIKALDGRVLFYRTEDYLFLYTLFSVIVRKYDIKVEMFCIMFNHIHACLYAQSETSFKSFCRDLSSIFTKGYNKEYHKEGKLLLRCGYSAKTAGKSIRSCLIYIANNPVSGRLVGKALDYKWNLLAYCVSNHPFSERLVKRESRYKMRQGLAFVDWCFKENHFLNYAMIARIFKNISARERSQIIDYVIVKYFFLDASEFIGHFGSIEKATVAIDSSAGAEHDIYEPWEDYSIYLSMLRMTLDSGLDFKRFRFQEMDPEDLFLLETRLSVIRGVTDRHLARFLHLSTGARTSAASTLLRSTCSSALPATR